MFNNYKDNMIIIYNWIKLYIFRILLVVLSATFTQVVFSIVYPDFLDPLVFFMNAPYLYIGFLIFIDIIIYLLVILIRTFRVLIYILPVVYFIITLLFLLASVKYNNILIAVLIVSISIYFVCILVRKYSFIIILPFIYFFICTVYYTYSLWSDHVESVGILAYSLLFDGFSKMYLFYSISSFPSAIIYLFRDKIKSRLFQK